MSGNAFATLSRIAGGRAPRAAPVGARVPPIWGRDLTALQDPNVAEQIRHFKNDVYKAVTFQANQIGKLGRTTVEVRLEQRDGGAVEEVRRPLRGHPLTTMLAKGGRGQPNNIQTSGLFVKQVVIDLGLTGSFYALKIRGTDGRPMWLLRLRPDLTKIVPDAQQGVIAYSYLPPGAVEKLFFDPREIVHIRYPSPLDARVGWSPLRSMAYGAELGDQIRKYQWQFFEQGARVDGIVTGVKDPAEMGKVYQLFTQRHYQGAEKAWLPMVIPPGLEFTPTQQTAKDFEFAALAQFSTEDILEAYGVPKGLLGTVTDVSLANLRGLMTIAAENGLKPLIGTIEEGLEQDLLICDWPESQGDTSWQEYDFDDPTPGDPDQERLQMVADLEHFVRNINEVRADRPALQPVDWGDRPWAGIGISELGEDDDGGDEGEQVDDEDDDDEDDDRGLAGLTIPPAPASARRAIAASRAELPLSLIEQILANVLGAEADAALVRQFRPLVLAALNDGADHVAGLMSVEVGTIHAMDEVREFLEQHVPQIVGVNDRTRRAVRDIVAKGVETGQGHTVVAGEIRKRFAGMTRNRARTIARTEAGMAWSAGSHAQMRGAGALGKIWIDSRDTRVRHSHRMDNQCVGIDQLFTLKSGVKIRYPLDVAAPLDEIVSCRCVSAPAPNGCGKRRGWLEREQDRAMYWRAVIARLDARATTVRRFFQGQFRSQQRAILAAIAEAGL